MLLRRITQHVKDQNWFAVALDFVIVVFGVFIGFQVNNWNNARQDNIREAVILDQLADEFAAIQTQLKQETEIAKERLEATKYVVELIDANIRTDSDKAKLALIRNMGLGRVPSTSATYGQLVANGDMTLIRDENLRRALIRYHDTIDKNAFLFERTLDSVANYISTNSAVTVDVNAPRFTDTNPDTITAINWDGVQSQRPYFVNTFIFNNLFYRFYTEELENAETVLSLIEDGAN